MVIPSFDLDEYFVEKLGNISQFINKYGYDAYAKRNVELYIQLKKIIGDKQVILVCSSGFMAYCSGITPEYLQLIRDIENDIYTFLLMPAFDLNECSKIIIKRQLSRLYLNTTAKKEEMKLKKRFDLYNNLNCRKVLTYGNLDEIVQNISFIILTDCRIGDVGN